MEKDKKNCTEECECGCNEGKECTCNECDIECTCGCHDEFEEDEELDSE